MLRSVACHLHYILLTCSITANSKFSFLYLIVKTVVIVTLVSFKILEFIPHMPESKLCGKNRKKSSDHSFCKYFHSENLQLKAERWNLFLPFVANVILNLTLTRLNYRRSRISYTSESVRLFLLFVCQTHLCVLIAKVLQNWNPFAAFTRLEMFNKRHHRIR